MQARTRRINRAEAFSIQLSCKDLLILIMSSAIAFLLMSIGTWLLLMIIWRVIILSRVAIAQPWNIIKFLREEGFSGPPLSIFLDNREEMLKRIMKARTVSDETVCPVDHNIWHRVFPHISDWEKLYGEKFFYRPGMGDVVLSGFSEPDVVKAMFAGKTEEFNKGYSALTETLVGRGLVTATDNEEWSRQRRVVRPIFYANTVKDNTGKMADIVKTWLDKLERNVIESGGTDDVDMVKPLAVLVREILAQVAFGIDFIEGKQAFENQELLKSLEFKSSGVPHPFFRLVPTRRNRQIRKLRNAITTTLKEIIERRRVAVQEGVRKSFGDDLLGVLLTSVTDDEDTVPHTKNARWTDDLLIDQCRTFFVAGTNTVSTSISWVLVNIAFYQEWQERIRQDIVDSPDGVNLNKPKSLHMFVCESLRLYPTAPLIMRNVVRDGVKLLGRPVPKNVTVHVDLVKLHRNKEIWGDDADEFKPQRFKNGIAQACTHLYGYIPFGAGPRSCVAQNLALTEVQLITAMLLQRFRIRLSPTYRHSPSYFLSLHPTYGVPLVLEKLNP